LRFWALNKCTNLKKIIPPEHLLKEYGGESDGRPSGGGTMDKYTHHLPKPFKVVVPAWKDFEKEIQVTKEGTVIGWEFKTKNKDIKFGVFLKSTQGKTKDSPIVPMTRYSSHKQIVAGFHTVENVGTYLLRWDNTYSNLYSKTVEYSIFVDGKIYEREGTEVDDEEEDDERKEENDKEEDEDETNTKKKENDDDDQPKEENNKMKKNDQLLDKKDEPKKKTKKQEE